LEFYELYDIYCIYHIYHIYRLATKSLPDNYGIYGVYRNSTADLQCLQCLQCLQGFPEFADGVLYQVLSGPYYDKPALNDAYQHHFHHVQNKNSASGRTPPYIWCGIPVLPPPCPKVTLLPNARKCQSGSSTLSSPTGNELAISHCLHFGSASSL
jgi:hypothetical protein